MSINIIKNGVWKSAKFAVKGNGELIPQIYYGNKLVLNNNGIVFEKHTKGTYTVRIPITGYYYIRLVGGGGGGAYGVAQSVGSAHNGGSAGYIYGTTRITAGTYTVVIGGGGAGSGGAGAHYGTDGGNTSFASNVAKGGGGANASYPGANGTGGGTTVKSSGLTGSSGTAGSTTSRYGSYGGGGAAKYLSYANAGQVGYAYIRYVGQSV